MTQTEQITEKKGDTCLIRIVGLKASDCLIRVYPAQHKEEKIWLSKQVGKERWETIKRIFNLHAPRTGIIPSPAPLMTEDLKTRTLRDEDIPMVKLENYVLPAPPPEEAKLAREEFRGDTIETANKISKMEKSIETLTSTVTSLANIMANMTKSQQYTLSPQSEAPETPTAQLANTPNEATKRGRGRPKKNAD